LDLAPIEWEEKVRQVKLNQERTMARQRRKYSEEFRREAVRLMEISRKPFGQIARDLV
jgi:transposase-like protein